MLCLIIKSTMTKKITLLAVFFLNLLLVNGQEKILLVGFSESNFVSEWKPIEKLAKKNSTTVEKVDDLYRSSLVNAMTTVSQEFDYVKGSDSDIDLLSSNKYSTLKNKKSKEYYGIESLSNKEEIEDLFEKYNVAYIGHITRYRMFMSMGLNLHTKIVHQIDYQIINKELKTVSADKMKLTAFLQGTFRPSGLVQTCTNAGKKLSKRLYIDLANKQGSYFQLNSNTLYASQADFLALIKKDYKYNPKQGIGFTGGWGAPYGFGIEYSYLITQNLDLNAGLGFSFSGLRTGIGTRYFFKDQGSSPFAGANFIYSSGLSGLEVSTSDGTGKYKVESDQGFFVRGGYKIEHYNKLFFINLGYGIPFNSKDAVWQSGEESSSQQDFANLMRLGGVEVSGSVVFRIGK
jgi:hypothetical protein